MPKKTYGQTIVDHREKNLTLDDDVIEYRQEMEPGIMRDIEQTAKKAKNTALYKGRDFYIVLLIKVERIGQAPRTLTFARRSCPTPTYKQSVWKYKTVSDTVEYMWTIPDAILYHHILRNSQKYLMDKECADLAKFVLLMESGELLDWVKKENGEKIDAVIKNNEENAWLMN